MTTMTTHTPTLITIKLLASASAPSIKDVQAALADFGIMLAYEANHLIFDGNSLVPAPVAASVVPAAAPAQAAAPAKKGGRKPGSGPVKAKAPKPAEELPNIVHAESPDGKVINFEEGSDPHKIWTLIRTSPAMTSTQIREKLGLGSNIVNTTIYRLKKAGMVRPMSYNAPNGDTLYTSTEWDPKHEKAEPVEEPKVNGHVIRLIEEDEDEADAINEDAF